MNKKTISRTIISFIAISLITLGYYHISHNKATGICPYNPSQDRTFILQLFKDNWHWLVSEYSTDFSPEYMLDNKASSKSPEHKNNLTIMMYHVNNKPVGFTAYYPKSFFMAQLLFIAVADTHRGCGYASHLLDYAIKDIFNHGYGVIQLITRVSNLKAQSLYKKKGFVEIWRDDGFIKFEKIK